jgi:hypothetical protein
VLAEIIFGEELHRITTKKTSYSRKGKAMRVFTPYLLFEAIGKQRYNELKFTSFDVATADNLGEVFHLPEEDGWKILETLLWLPQKENTRGVIRQGVANPTKASDVKFDGPEEIAVIGLSEDGELVGAKTIISI